MDFEGAWIKLGRTEVCTGLFIDISVITRNFVFKVLSQAVGRSSDFLQKSLMRIWTK